MKSLEEIRGFFQGDRLATSLGMVIDSVTEEEAVCSVVLAPDHLNAVGMVQGGLVFTLADFAFAVAANHQVCDTVTLDSTVHFLSPAGGTRLTATARVCHRTRKTCLVETAVTDDTGALVARVTATGYRTAGPGGRRHAD